MSTPLGVGSFADQSFRVLVYLNQLESEGPAPISLLNLSFRPQVRITYLFMLILGSIGTVHPFLSIDLILFGVFLALNLIIGIKAGLRVKDVKEFALGGKTFSTGTITSTIVAT